MRDMGNIREQSKRRECPGEKLGKRDKGFDELEGKVINEEKIGSHVQRI